MSSNRSRGNLVILRQAQPLLLLLLRQALRARGVRGRSRPTNNPKAYSRTTKPPIAKARWRSQAVRASGYSPPIRARGLCPQTAKALRYSPTLKALVFPSAAKARGCSPTAKTQHYSPTIRAPGYYSRTTKARCFSVNLETFLDLCQDPRGSMVIRIK